MERNETEPGGYIAPKPVATEKGSLDHVLDVLASHRHPFLLVGCAAQRWIGSAGTMTDVHEILIRQNTLKAVASDLLATERWEINERDPEDIFGNDPVMNCDADIVLRQTSTENEDEFRYLALWSDTAYHLDIDSCITIEVPDVTVGSLSSSKRLGIQLCTERMDGGMVLVCIQTRRCQTRLLVRIPTPSFSPAYCAAKAQATQIPFWSRILLPISTH